MTYLTSKIHFDQILLKIIDSPILHGKWLNTLSYWENCGARKLAKCEHPTKVKEEMLKHAAEEFRHAFYLKQQIHKLSISFLEDYRLCDLIGGVAALHYFHRLEIEICRFLKQKGYEKVQFHLLAYLLITFAIECRAKKVYDLYHQLLKHRGSTIRIYSILLEEEEHLREIKEEIELIENASLLCVAVCQIEEKLFDKWLFALNHSKMKD